NKVGKVAYRRVRIGQTIGKLRAIKDASYQLTDESITALRGDGLSDAVTARLEKLKETLKAKDALPEGPFLVEVGKVLSGEDFKTVKSAVLKRAIAEGLLSTDRVVITNMQRVRPKDQVQVKEVAPPAKPEIAHAKAADQPEVQ